MNSKNYPSPNGSPQLLILVYLLFQNGSTCAHIAAAKGSVGVLLELMKFDKSVVIHARNKERSRRVSVLPP